MKHERTALLIRVPAAPPASEALNVLSRFRVEPLARGVHVLAMAVGVAGGVPSGGSVHEVSTSRTTSTAGSTLGDSGSSVTGRSCALLQQHRAQILLIALEPGMSPSYSREVRPAPSPRRRQADDGETPRWTNRSGCGNVRQQSYVRGPRTPAVRHFARIL